MIRLIANLIARLAAPRRQPPDPPGLPAAEAEQMRQALHAPFDDPDPMHWLLCTEDLNEQKLAGGRDDQANCV